MRFSWKSTHIGRTGAVLSLSYALMLVGCSANNGDALAPRGKEMKSDQTHGDPSAPPGKEVKSDQTHGDALAPRGKEMKGDQTQGRTMIVSEQVRPADIRFFSVRELGPGDPDIRLVKCKLAEAEGTFVVKLLISKFNDGKPSPLRMQFSARLFTKDGQPVPLQESPGPFEMTWAGSLSMSANLVYKFVRPAQMSTADLGWITVGYKGRVHQVPISEATQTDAVGPVDSLEKDLPSRLAPGPFRR